MHMIAFDKIPSEKVRQWDGRVVIYTHSTGGGKKIKVAAGTYATGQEFVEGYWTALVAQLGAVKSVDIFSCYTGDGSFAKDFKTAAGLEVSVRAPKHLFKLSGERWVISDEEISSSNVANVLPRKEGFCKGTLGNQEGNFNTF